MSETYRPTTTLFAYASASSGVVLAVATCGACAGRGSTPGTVCGVPTRIACLPCAGAGWHAAAGLPWPIAEVTSGTVVTESA